MVILKLSQLSHLSLYSIQRRWLLITSLIVLILDFVTKHFVRVFEPNIQLLSFFSLSYTTNTGGAFGIFRGLPWLFIVAGVIVMGIIAYYYKRIPQNCYYIISIGLILGGTLGNLLDRVLLGQVTDFIAFSFWPAFNIADSALSIGMVCLAILLWREDMGVSNTSKKTSKKTLEAKK